MLTIESWNVIFTECLRGVKRFKEYQWVSKNQKPSYRKLSNASNFSNNCQDTERQPDEGGCALKKNNIILKYYSTIYNVTPSHQHMQEIIAGAHGIEGPAPQTTHVRHVRHTMTMFTWALVIAWALQVHSTASADSLFAKRVSINMRRYPFLDKRVVQDPADAFFRSQFFLTASFRLFSSTLIQSDTRSWNSWNSNEK